MSRRILAGIVVFNPDPERLRENYAAIKDQVETVVVYDNGGLDPGFFDESIARLGDGSNAGIAYALNAICEYAEKEGFEWAITLDQDSVTPKTLIGAYSAVLDYCEHTGIDNVGMVCPTILDRNYGSMSYDTGALGITEETDACITSGSMINISAWKAAGGFWNALFIDMVDFDICWSLKERGYRIIRLNDQILLQEIGHARRVRLFGKDEVVYNHSPLRCYYMVRNTLAVGRKHGRRKQCRRWALKRILLVNLFEKGRIAKDWMILKGIFDASRLKAE